MSAPGLFLRMGLMRDHLEGALDTFHTGAYLHLINHPQRPALVDLERCSERLEAAYRDYRAQLERLLCPPPV